MSQFIEVKWGNATLSIRHEKILAVYEGQGKTEIYVEGSDEPFQCTYSREAVLNLVALARL